MNEPETNEREGGTRRAPPEGAPAGAPLPLPRDWLPEARAPEGHPTWELHVARVMAAADAALSKPALAPAAPPSALASPSPVVVDSPSPPIAPPWWSEMGRWWKASAGLAAASLLLFFGLPDRPWPDGAGVEGDQFTLGMVVAEGDPAAFWHALGVPADPVLALLTFAEPGAAPTPADPATPPSNPTTPPEGDM